VDISRDWVDAGPLASLSALPLCATGADRPGLWRNVGNLGASQQVRARGVTLRGSLGDAERLAG
jgi:hypothetical protein